MESSKIYKVGKSKVSPEHDKYEEFGENTLLYICYWWIDKVDKVSKYIDFVLRPGI